MSLNLQDEMRQSLMFEALVMNGKQKLKISEHRDGIMEKVANVVYENIKLGDKRPIIIQAGTGIGKSSVFLYHLYKLAPMFKVICSQVTFANVRSLFDYVSSMPGMQQGSNIGYQTGQGVVDIQGTGIMYQTVKTTTNIILKPLAEMTQAQPNSILIIDEAHANDVNMVEQLAFLNYIYSEKSNIPHQSKPYVIVQSASINPFEYARYLSTDYIITISGQRFPVASLYIEQIMKTASVDQLMRSSISQCAVEAVKQILSSNATSEIGKAVAQTKTQKDGPILIFVPSQQMINEIKNLLEHESENFQALKGIPVLPFSKAAIDNDYKLVQSVVQSKGMRIILSTNVIETGFTIPDLSYVIDTLKYLQAYYNPVTKMDILRFLPVSISMHQQRKGRVGRVQGGVYIALAPQSVVAQLKREESCIRYTDIKQLLLEMGNLFYKLEFIQPIPQEITIDALQLQLLTGWSNKSISIHLGMLGSENLRISVFNRYLIIKVLELGGRLLDILQIVVFIDSMDIKSMIKPRRLEYVNDFREILEEINQTNLAVFPSNFLQSFARACQHMISVNLDIYQGLSLSEHPDILQKALEAAYLLNYMVYKKTVSGQAMYYTLYGQKIFIKFSKEQTPPKFLVCNKIIDSFGRIKAEFIAEAQTPDLSRLCVYKNK